MIKKLCDVCEKEVSGDGVEGWKGGGLVMLNKFDLNISISVGFAMPRETRRGQDLFLCENCRDWAIASYAKSIVENWENKGG